MSYLSSIFKRSSSPQPVTAKEAALIATFYGSREKGRLQSLVDLLCEKLSLVPLTEQVDGRERKIADNWINENGPSLLARFDPAAASDTTVVQLALNHGGEVASAWADLCKRLSLAVDKESLKAIRAYTLIYQAVSDDLPEADQASIHPTLERLLAHAQPLHTEPKTSAAILAHAKVKGGQVWLLKLPLERDGVEAATVYVALAGSKQQDQLIEQVLYGSQAQLLMPDLIAHKAYHQRRQYHQNEVKQNYEHFAKHLRQSADNLLAASNTQANARHIKNLEQDYRRFMRALPEFRELRLSMARQQHNFERWQSQLQHEGDLLTLHYNHIETICRELDILLDKGEDTQTAVETTIRILQSDLQQAAQQRERTFQYWLALIGIMLAGPQFVSESVAKQLLRYVNINQSWGTYEGFLVLGLQIIGTMVVGVLMWLIVSLFRWFRS